MAAAIRACSAVSTAASSSCCASARAASTAGRRLLRGSAGALGDQAGEEVAVLRRDLALAEAPRQHCCGLGRGVGVEGRLGAAEQPPAEVDVATDRLGGDLVTEPVAEPAGAGEAADRRSRQARTPTNAPVAHTSTPMGAVAGLDLVRGRALEGPAQPAGEVAARREADDRHPDEPDARADGEPASDTPSPGSAETIVSPMAEPKVSRTSDSAAEGRAPARIAAQST